MMDESRFEDIKRNVLNDFVKHKILTHIEMVKLFEDIQINSTIEMFCPKCKYASKINIYNFDDHVSIQCETCLEDFHNVEFDLKKILFFDIMQKKRQEKKGILL